jgi:hypothetical protein
MQPMPNPAQSGWWFLCTLLAASPTMATDTTVPAVRERADQTFDRLQKREQAVAPTTMDPPRHEHTLTSNSELFLIGRGQGDLGKGKLVCQRVSELAARADIAKQIRVLVKEHATDRLRERTGRETEQDIEVVREEIVQEYLQGVTITEHHTDEEAKTCSAVAVMPKNRLPANPSTDSTVPDSSTPH